MDRQIPVTPEMKEVLRRVRKANNAPERPPAAEFDEPTYEIDPDLLLAWGNLSQHPDFPECMNDLLALLRFGEMGDNMYHLASQNLANRILTRLGVQGDDVRRAAIDAARGVTNAR